jgi:hypothetical protein
MTMCRTKCQQTVVKRTREHTLHTPDKCMSQTKKKNSNTHPNNRTQRNLTPVQDAIRRGSMAHVGGFAFQQSSQEDADASSSRVTSLSRSKTPGTVEQQLRSDIQAAFVEIMVAAADPQVGGVYVCILSM